MYVTIVQLKCSSVDILVCNGKYFGQQPAPPRSGELTKFGKLGINMRFYLFRRNKKNSKIVGGENIYQCWSEPWIKNVGF